jgi:hypothetical protein
MKIARIRGYAAIKQANGQDTLFTSVVPIPPSQCTFLDSQEPAELMLTLPDGSTRNGAAGDAFRLNEASVQWANQRLKDILKKDPSVRNVLVTVEGLVRVRKYRLDDIPPMTALPPGSPNFITIVPQHVPAPVTLIVQSFIEIGGATRP